MNSKFAYCVVAALGFLGCVGSQSAGAQSRIVYEFSGTSVAPFPPAIPSGPVIMDGGGALYGVTFSGGPANVGTVYRLTRPGVGSPWTITTLYGFLGSADGSTPQFGLAMDRNGTLYGVTEGGGVLADCFGYGCGTVFRLTPPGAGETAWTKTTLANMPESNTPSAGPLIGADGALYVPTYRDYTSPGTYGAIFKLTPPAAGQTGWTNTAIYQFTGREDGSDPSGTLIMDAAGKLFGTASYGGMGTKGDGTVFELLPPLSGQAARRLAVLHRFTGPDGSTPASGVVFGKGGVLYGTTLYLPNGPDDGFAGTVFKLTQPAEGGGAWDYQLIHAFDNDGATPDAVVMDAKGRLIGSTFFSAHGGRRSYFGGTIFELTPPVAGLLNWTETGLIQLDGRQGYDPRGVAIGTDNHVYVPTEAGARHYGSVLTVDLPGH